MRSIDKNEISPFLRYARTIHVTPDYSYNGIAAYDARAVYILSGGGKLSVGSRSYRLAPGTLIIWQAGQVYGFQDVTESVDLIMLNFDFTGGGEALLIPDRAEVFDASRVRSYPAFTDGADDNGVFYRLGAFDTEPLMRSLVDEYTMCRVNSDLASKGLLTTLVAKASRPAANDRRADELIAYINSHASEKMTYASLGAAFGYHPNHTGRLVRNAVGMPLHAYVMKIRVSRALALLSEEGRTVAETAELCGFPDSASFSKRFKAETGATPASVRRRKNV